MGIRQFRQCPSYVRFLTYLCLALFLRGAELRFLSLSLHSYLRTKNLGREQLQKWAYTHRPLRMLHQVLRGSLSRVSYALHPSRYLILRNLMQATSCRLRAFSRRITFKSCIFITFHKTSEQIVTIVLNQTDDLHRHWPLTGIFSEI